MDDVGVDDRFDLERYIDAQDAGASFDCAVAELERGRKTSHWMWFVFPQIAGLGRSATSQHYAISGFDEACAYLAHPVLGPRLLQCAGIVAATTGRSADQIFGSVDAQKLHSSMTLFTHAGADAPVFGEVLQRCFDGRPDPATLQRLAG